MRRIAFCGASGTGKTTLARWLEEKLSIPMNPVGSRSVAKAMGFESPYDTDKAGKRGDFQRRLQADKIAWENAHESFVTDRTTLDELVYTSLHDVSVVNEVYLANARLHVERYTHIVYCPLEDFCKLDGDPKRNPSMTYQKLFDIMLQGVLDEWARKRVRWFYDDEVTIVERQEALSRYLELL